MAAMGCGTVAAALLVAWASLPMAAALSPASLSDRLQAVTAGRKTRRSLARVLAPAKATNPATSRRYALRVACT